MVSEVVASHVPSHMRARVIPILGHPYPEALTPADMLPWASVPERNRQQLASGSTVGGPLADALCRDAGLPGPSADRSATRVLPCSSSRSSVAMRGGVTLASITASTHWPGRPKWQCCARRPTCSVVRCSVGRPKPRLEQHAGTLLSGCIGAVLQVLLATPADPGRNGEILNQALGTCLTGTQASRAYVARNFDDPELGFCNGLYAEVCGPGVARASQTPSTRGSPGPAATPWRLALEAGRPLGDRSRRCLPIRHSGVTHFSGTTTLAVGADRPDLRVKSGGGSSALIRRTKRAGGLNSRSWC